MITHNVDDLLRGLAAAPEKVRLAEVRTVNDVAFNVRRDWQDEMQRVFDRPTPYILRSIWVRRATPQQAQATVEPRYMGGKGIDPSKVLLAHVTGGTRRNKRFEVALQRAGHMLPGMAAVPADGMDPGHMDAYGNVKGSFIVQLLSYLQAFSEQGYRANMTARRRANLAQRGTTAEGHKTINGVEYFVSHGPGERNGRRQGLPAGIWSRRGIHGSDVRPVFIFVKTRPSYSKRLDLQRIADIAVARDFNARYRANLGKVLG